MERHKLILDCDPGHDDAVAFLLAKAFGRILGVTTVAGNAGVDVTTRNAMTTAKVLDYAGDIVAGARCPLIQARSTIAAPPFPPLDPALDDGTLPESSAANDAASFIAEQADGATWLVTTGPLTNVALALRRAPHLGRCLAGISIMGGSATVGNITPVAEFNVWSDPEAAHIVLSSGLPIRMCGLHVTHDILVDYDFTRKLRDLGTSCSRFFAQLLEDFIRTYPDAFVGQSLAPLHDPCAVLAVTHPQLFRWQRAHVAVELAGQLTRGMTVVDRRENSDLEPNVQLALAGDRQGILDAIYEAVTSID